MARESPELIGFLEGCAIPIPIVLVSGNEKYDKSIYQRKDQTMSKFDFNTKSTVSTVSTVENKKPVLSADGFSIAKGIESSIKENFGKTFVELAKVIEIIQSQNGKINKLENQIAELIKAINSVKPAEKPAAEKPAEKPAVKPAEKAEQSITGWSIETRIPIAKIERMIELYQDDHEFDCAVFAELSDDFDPDRGAKFIAWLERQNGLLKTKKPADHHIVRKQEKPAAQSINLPYGPSVPDDKKAALTAELIKCQDLADLKKQWGKCRTTGIAGFTGFFCSANKLADFWAAIESNK